MSGPTTEMTELQRLGQEMDAAEAPTMRERLARASYERAYPSGVWADVSEPWRDYWFTIVDAFLAEQAVIAREASAHCEGTQHILNETQD